MRISKIIPTLILFHLLLLVGVAAVTARESRPRYTNEPAADITDERIVIEPIEVNGDAVYIVRLKDDPLATYRGGIGTIEATNPATLGRKQLDMSNSASTTYLEYLATEQDKFLSATSKILDRDITPIYQYDVVYNGVAFEMSSAEAKQVARIPGVINVQHDSWRYKETDVTPNFVGATNIWDGSAFGGISSKGEGIIVGVIDTGIWPEHPSFVDDGSYLTPVGWNGGCSSPADGSPSYVCNNKLVGAQHFLAGYTIALGGYDGLFNSARDDDGHGTHTASTAAGNENVAVTLLGVNRGSVSGMAPRAHIAAYKGLGPQGGLTSDLVAAIEAAVADGVDVINYSIGGGANDPWNDADAQAFLAARSAGVFVATSAGNSGPNSGTVGSPGDSPWITTVGASTSNRRFISEITIFGPGSPPSGLFGAAISAGIQNFNLVDAEGIYDSKGDNSGLCLNPFLPGTFNANDVVFCQRGQIALVLRGAHVKAGGGGGVILYNPTMAGLATDSYEIPAVHVESDVGQRIKDYLALYPGQIKVSFSAGQEVYDSDPRVTADLVATFSSRGPNLTVTDVLKPNLSAPGVQILAGASPQHVGPGAQGELFQAIQGTSMSSPHVAGAAALLAAIHRDWTPAEIESALMTTTNRNQFKKDGVTPADPFDTGSGRIDLKSAVQAPLVLDELYANYLSADPGKNGDPSTLNIASLADADCVNSCDWTRVLRNTTSETMSWRTSLSNLNGTVIPGNFTLQPNEEISIEVTVDATGMSRGEWTFGSLDIIPQSGGGGSGVVPSTHMPIAIIPDERIVAEVVDILTRRDAGSHLVENLLGPEITDLNLHAKGLVPGENFLVTLAEDPTPDDPFDNLNQVWWQLVPVMPDSSRLVNEIRESEAQDVHLYIGFDSNGDRKPDEDEVECIGMTAGGDAYCNLEYPQEGDWWVLVQNRNSTQMGLFDSILLSTGIVGNFDGGNMMFDAPATVPVQEPFDLRIKYDLQNLVEGQVWYGSVDVGTDANNSDNIARIEINLYRVSDDVTKQVNIHYPAPGDRVVFDILIQPNVLDEDIEYEVNDMIPDGMTYVSESARASAGAVEVVDNKLTWIGTLLNPNQLQPSYKMSTSDSDLACDTGFNGYVNLEDHGIFTQETVQGDSKAFRFFATGGPIMFFGQQFDSLYITDDGFAVFDPDQNYQGQGHIPQLIPDKLKPNNIAAMLWQDMRIVYDKEKNHGVSAATVGSNVMIVEYDDIQRKDSASQTYDFEIIMTRQVNDVPGAYEIVFAYDNIHVLDEGAVTVGVEDAAGQIGTTLINQESAVNVLKNGLMVCFDTIKPSSEPVVISYEVQINEDVEIGTEIINQVISTISHIGSKPEATTSQVTVSYRSFLPINLVMNISE